MPYAANGLWYDESGAGPALVCLHEGIVDSRSWGRAAPLLAESFRVVRYDQRGYGRSPMWTGPYSPVADLVALLNDLQIERAALAGCSRGGRIALATALEAPARVSALILIASALPGHPLVLEGTPEQEARWEEAEARGDVAELAQLDLEFWAPLGADEELRTMVHENAAASNAEDPATEPDVKARLDEISVPTLVVTGGRDVAAINEVGEILARRIAGARSAVIEDADHMVPWRAPEELARLVRGFL